MSFKKFFFRLLVFLAVFALVDFATSELMLKGLNKFYGFDKNPRILINGSSMSISGFNKSDIEIETNQKVSLYAKEGVGIEDRYVMLEQFFSEHPRTVKTVIYEINPLLFSNKLTANNVYTIFYPYIDNGAINEYIKKRAGKLDYVVHKYCHASRFDALTINFVLKGYLNNYNNFKTGSLNSQTAYFSNSELGKVMLEKGADKLKVFEKTMKLLQDNNTDVVLVMMPVYSQKQATFDTVSYNNLVTFYKTYSTNNKNVVFLDLNTKDFSHNALLFSDLLHLNREGQKKVTRSVSAYLKAALDN